jgi:hypothetical protein
VITRAFTAALTEFLEARYALSPLDLDTLTAEELHDINLRKATLDLLCDVIDSALATSGMIAPPNDAEGGTDVG